MSWSMNSPPGLSTAVLSPTRRTAGPLSYKASGSWSTTGQSCESQARSHSVSWASDGSIAVVEGAHERLERWQGNRLVDAVEIPDRLGGEAPVLSPDNCAALFQDVDQFWFEVIALDCFEAERADLLILGDSTSVAWSPDGR